MSIILLYAVTRAASPWSYRGCFDAQTPTVKSLYDKTCVTWRLFDEKCMDGLPFYRFTSVEGCSDCLSPSYCKLQCLSRGLDVAGLISQGGVPAECRCGASLSNHAVWSSLKNSTANFMSTSYLQPPESRISSGCNMDVWDFTGPRDDQGYPVTAVTSKRSGQDEDYVQAIVTGTFLKSSRDNSVKLRQHRWLRLSQGKGIIEGLKLVETTAHESLNTDTTVHSDAASLETEQLGCTGVVENQACWEKAMSDIPACGNHCTPDSWQTQGYAQQWVNFTTASARCPITAGHCRLFQRPRSRSNSVPLWPSSSIPIYVNTSNRDLPDTALGTVTAAASVWSVSACMSFSIVTTPPKQGPYATVVARKQRGRFAGCSAPLGPPADGKVAEINIASCSGNDGVGMLAHELGHLIGFTSTLQRPDRDSYVQINWDNIDPYYYENFRVDPYQFVGSGGLPVPYDFGSIMHPSPWAGMIIGFNDHLPDPGTFKARVKPKAGIAIGQRISLSEGDIQAVKLLYGCPLSEIEKSVLRFASSQSSDSMVSGQSSSNDSSDTSVDNIYADVATQATYIAKAISRITDEYAYNGGYLATDQITHLLRISNSTAALVDQCQGA